MGPVLHHLRKDLRRLWPLLVVWLGVLAIQALIPSDPLAEHPPPLLRLRSPLLLAQWSLTILLPALLILADPLRGSRAFWLTRPISRGQLLASKALGLALFVLGPLLAFHLVELLGVGLQGTALLLALAESALYVTGLVLASAALASLSASLTELVVLAVLCALAGELVVPVLVSSVLELPDLKGSLWQSQQLTMQLLLLVAAAGVLLHQALTRRTGRSAALAVVAVVIFAAVPFAWSWDLLAPTHQPLEPVADLEVLPPEAGHCLEVSRAQLLRAGLPENALGAPGEVELCARFVFDTASQPLEWEIESLESRLSFPDGRSIERQTGSIGRSTAAEAEEPAQPWVHHPLLSTSQQLYERYARVEGVLEGELVVRGYRRRRLGSLSLVDGETLRAAGVAATIERVAITGGDSAKLELETRLQWLQLKLDPESGHRMIHLRLDHRLSDLVSLSQDQMSGLHGSFFLAGLKLTTEQREQLFQLTPYQREQLISGQFPATIDELLRSWREGRLVIDDRVAFGTYHARIRVEGFRMADYVLSW